MLEALHEAERLEPRGLTAELLGWELDIRLDELEPTLVRAHARGYIERAGLDKAGVVLWQLGDRGRALIAASGRSSADRSRRGSEEPPPPPR